MGSSSTILKFSGKILLSLVKSINTDITVSLNDFLYNIGNGLLMNARSQIDYFQHRGSAAGHCDRRRLEGRTS